MQCFLVVSTGCMLSAPFNPLLIIVRK